MSNTQSQQQKKNRKAFSKTLKAQIKRKPHTEPINGKQFTYGLLQKKSESSLFNNERFLIIKGHQTFGYASKLPDQTLLPFLQQKNIPKCKVQIELDKLQINNQKQVLIVQFQQEKKKQKTKWQFTCGSKVKAIQWRQKLQGAKSQKIAAIKNKAVKVILQDPNQSVQQSQNQIQKKKKIVIQNNFSPNTNNQKKQGLSIGNQNIPKQQDKKIVENNNILIVKDQELSGQKKISPEKQNINVQQKIQSNKQQKYPQVNIFQSLLYSSPGRQIDTQSRQNVESSRQKSISNTKSFQNTKQKSQIFHQSKSIQQQSPNKAKQQFLKRKKEESEIKEQLLDQNSNNVFLGSVLKTLTDNKYQLQKLKKQWSYQFAKGVNEYEIVQHFKTYVQIIVVKIIDQLALQARKRYYKPVSQSSESLKYQIDGVSLEFFFHQLKEIISFQKKGSIISNQRSKRAYQQLKNYDYILQLTNNKGRIRVPLAMCVQYKGFVCLAKALIPEAQNYSNLQSLQKQLDLLQAQSRISNSIFEEGQNGRIVPLNNKLFDKLARTQNNFTNNKKFDICYVQGLKNYLPQDFYRYNSQQGKNGQLTLNSSHILRRQLIQDEQYDEAVFYGENMSNVIQRLKIPQHLKQAVDTLSQVSKSISDRVNALVGALQNLDQFITNSKDLSKLMHGYGLNMRYLGLLLQRSHESWLKKIIVSQISARCAKIFFQFDLQDCITNLNQTKIQNIRRYQIKQVILFMNKVLGNSEESDLFWNQLSRQSQQNFQCYVDKKQLNLGYFLQALQQQCRVQLINIFQKKEQIFKVSEPLSTDNFCSFTLNSKTYDLSFTQLYATVNQHLKEITQQTFEQLSILLNLQRKGSLPSHFQLNSFDQKIILYMINWLSPTQGRSIYYPEEIRIGEIMPTKALYQIKLTQIKWLLKEKKQNQAEKVRDWIIEHVNKWLGEYHPILSQLYDLFSRYYLTSKQQEKKSTTYCKSSIKNIQKLLGQSNIKLADNYYMLAEIYINYQKKTQALNSLRRAKEILQEREGQQTEAYGIIQLRMGQLLLANNMIKEALTQSIKAYSRLVQSDDLQKFVESLQLVGRCYELTQMWSEYQKFVDQFINNNNKLLEVADNQQLLERTLKVLILPCLSQITKNGQTSKQLLSALTSFTSIINATSTTQASSYAYIKSLIEQQNKVFPQQFLSILQIDLQELLQQVQLSGIMTRWKGFEALIMNRSLIQKMNSISVINAKTYEFLLTLQALAVFLGEGWMQGVLKDH